jgi:uncharacterized membrane protein YjjP (DUF1212 family)
MEYILFYEQDSNSNLKIYYSVKKNLNLLKNIFPKNYKKLMNVKCIYISFFFFFFLSGFNVCTFLSSFILVQIQGIFLYRSFL